jgi:DNA-binding CsgD family transcriptional regulator
MGSLAETDLVALGEFAARLPRSGDPRDFGGAVLAPLRSLIRCDSITYNEVDLRRSRAFSIVDPSDALDAGDAAVFDRYLAQHPVIAYSSATGDGRAHMLSDFLSHRELRRTDLWNEYFRPVSVDYQLAICLLLEPGLIVGIAFNRARRDFDQRDRELIDLARPLVAASYRTAQLDLYQREVIAAYDAALNSDGHGVIACRADGHVLAVTSMAERLLSEYLGVLLAPGHQLPGRLADLFVHAPGPRQRLVVNGARARLRVRRVVQDGRNLLVLDEVPYVVAADIALAGITQREAQILDLLAAGHSTAEVADHLGIKQRTIDKHIEHIRIKLNVSSRSAAVARWLLA